jgi:hypothetical protein
MDGKPKNASKKIASEERARAFNALLALRGTLVAPGAEEYLAAERRKDEEKLEAWARGEEYVRPE